MKRIGLILTCILLFAVSLYVAYMQGINYVDVNGPAGIRLSAPLMDGQLSAFWTGFLNVFSFILSGFARLFGGSLIAAVVVLALLVELFTLYPAVNLQLKQKKIHLFHKKLVDRFHSGELSMSKSKRELDVLYSVNERIHRRGALLFVSQLVVFVVVFTGLYLLSGAPALLNGAFSSFNYALISAPSDAFLPLLAGLAYLLHSLVRIYLKQQEDYIDAKQVYTAVGLGVFFAALIFYFATIFPVLLTVYLLSQITFATMRYVVVEEHAKAWGNFAQRELIKLLKSARIHRNKTEHLIRRFHHLPIVRHLNFHLLEEAVSMSLVIVLALNALVIM